MPKQKKYALGCVPYQNAKPIVQWLELQKDKIPVEIIYEEPSRLPLMLETHLFDAIFTSSFNALQTKDLKILKGVSISSFNQIGSVKIFSKVPADQIKSIALDQSSLTSIHLAQIILKEKYHLTPITKQLPPDLHLMLQDFDAAVLIGDRCINVDEAGLYEIDLGKEWHDLTGKPFVWALWMGRGNLDKHLARLILESKKWGILHLKEIIEMVAQNSKWPLAFCKTYYRKNLDFNFKEEHLEGLLLFQKYLLKHGFIQTDHFPQMLE